MKTKKLACYILLSITAITSIGCSGPVSLNPRSEKLCENLEERLVVLRSVVDKPSLLAGGEKIAELGTDFNARNQDLMDAVVEMHKRGIKPDFSRFDEFMIRFADVDSKCRKELERLSKADFFNAGDTGSAVSNIYRYSQESSNPFREAP